MSTEFIDNTCFAELSGVLGYRNSRERLSKHENKLWPMYHALPKDQDGGLDHGFVRYALHRFFVQQHGWYVNGFDPEGELWNATTATEML